MSKEEKRYFKLFVQGVGQKESSHLRLFNVLSKQKTYNKTAAKKALSFIKNFGATEHYLYQLLLKTLRVYRSSSSTEMRILDSLKDIQILFDCQLYDLAQTTLVDLKKLAIKYDKLYFLPQIYEWQIRIELEGTRFEGIDFNMIKEEYLGTLQQIVNYGQYATTAVEVALLARESGGNKEIQEHLDKIMQATWLQDIEHCQSLSAKLIFWELQSIYYSTHQMEKSLTACLNIIEELHQAGPHMLQQRHKLYSIMIANAAYFAIHLSQWEKVEELLNLIKQLPKKFITPRFQLIAYYVHLILYNHRGELDHVQEVIDAGETLVLQYTNKITLADVAVWKYYVALTHFMKENYDDALPPLEYLRYLEIDKGLQYAARLLTLVTLYEQESFELLDSFLRSNYRFFKKKTDPDSFELTMISCLRQLCKLFVKNSAFKSDADLKQIRDRIKVYYEKQEFWHAYLPYCFDYLAWLDSKIQNVPITKIMKQKSL
ncbi:MAG: hypothetical protein GY810_07750 [Aureispira sp.]|nr:hypothetical protein [Aureispira sp.]